MAKFASILSASGSAAVRIAALATTTSSAEQFIGNNQIFVINSDKDITIKFGITGMGAATVSDLRIPANTMTVFDMGHSYTHIRVFNMDGTNTAQVSWQQLSVG